jgi:hypothetical protein
MTSKVKLIVPDAGPLITLGRGKSLDLLLRLDMPVYIVDQVEYETTKDLRFPDAVEIKKFIAEHPNDVHVIETFVGSALAARRVQGDTGRKKGAGEAAAAELFARLDEIVGDADAPALMLFEDDDVLSKNIVLPKNVHLLSTTGLLFGLEKRGIIPSAEDVITKINNAGRFPQMQQMDRPGEVNGLKTKW